MQNKSTGDKFPQLLFGNIFSRHIRLTPENWSLLFRYLDRLPNWERRLVSLTQISEIGRLFSYWRVPLPKSLARQKYVQTVLRFLFLTIENFGTEVACQKADANESDIRRRQKWGAKMSRRLEAWRRIERRLTLDLKKI